MLKTVLAVLSGPVVYGLVCVPCNWVIVKLFPSHFDERWQTQHVGLLLLMVSLTVVYGGASGLVGGSIAGEHVRMATVGLCVVQLGIGVAVQRQYWEALPLWYHLSFFVLLLAGIVAGAWLSAGMDQHGVAEGLN